MKPPYTIRTIIEQMGGLGLSGAPVYCGAHQFAYKCRAVEMECRSAFRSRETDHGLLDYDVGLTFRVNGKRGQNWTMLVAYEPNDTYSVWLWRKGAPSEQAAGKYGVVLATRDDVYCDTLKETVERMYDEAIRKHCRGFIPA